MSLFYYPTIRQATRWWIQVMNNRDFLLQRHCDNCSLFVTLLSITLFNPATMELDNKLYSKKQKSKPKRRKKNKKKLDNLKFSALKTMNLQSENLVWMKNNVSKRKISNPFCFVEKKYVGKRKGIIWSITNIWKPLL